MELHNKLPTHRCAQLANTSHDRALMQIFAGWLPRQLLCSRCQRASRPVTVCLLPATHIVNLQVVFAHATQESPGLASSEEAVEPTLVLQFPPQAVTAMHLDQAPACPTDTAPEAQHSTAVPGTMQACTSSPWTDQHPAQGCDQIDCSPSKQSIVAAQPKDVALLTHLQPDAAVSTCEADDAVHQRSDMKGGGTARLPEGQPEAATVSAVPGVQATRTPGTLKQGWEQYHCSLGKLATQLPQQPADLGRQPAMPEMEADVVAQQPDSTKGTAVSNIEQSSKERVAIADEPNDSVEGHATAAEGRTAKRDGQSLGADDHKGTADSVIALGDKPAVLEDTISEACCVCKFAEDGEIMLLCDECDQPAHLGCVGVDSVPEGDWFCPSCTSAMVRILTISDPALP